jgi:putative GTP pyrophosphokinase
MSDRVEHIPVEIQIRTIAMDFWASLEHKIFYKYNKDIPKILIDELKEAATIATKLDEKMERLNQDINVYKENDQTLEEYDSHSLLDNDDFKLPSKLIESILEATK